MSTRLGEFRRAVKAGEPLRHAAYSAREVSVDFGMRGDSAALGFFYDTVIFLKPAVNGMDRLYRGVAHDPNKVQIAVRAGIIAVVSVGLSAINRGNPLYDDLEEWDKNSHWHFFIPRPETIQAWADGRPLPPLNDRYWHFRLMKLWEIGGIASFAERSFERSMDGQPEKIPGDAWRILRDVFRFEYIPQAIAPLYELAINRNRFLDRPIETPAMRELQPWARHRPGGSRTMRALGEAERGLPTALQVSPAKVEALLRGYLNTWAMYGLTLSDAVFFDDSPSLRTNQYPVIRRFAPGKVRRTREERQFYEALHAATQARRTMREMQRRHRPDIAEELAESQANLEYQQLSNVSRDEGGLAQILRNINVVIYAPDLANLRQYAEGLRRKRPYRERVNEMRRGDAWDDLGDLKAALLDMWVEEKNALMKGVMESVEAQRQQREAAR